MTVFRIKLCSLAREYGCVTAHTECGCSFYTSHEKLLLKILIFALQGNVKIKRSSLIFQFQTSDGKPSLSFFW
jgi:hypothetical protein